MQGNIIDYVYTYGLFDFKTLPFGPVDALVLAQFAYIKVNCLVDTLHSTAKPITIKELSQRPGLWQLFSDTRWEALNRALFEQMCESKRYADMQCIYSVDYVNEEEEYQFAAVTCILNDGSVKILYRGTDETLVGWKEDFNMGFQYPIPGQQYGRDYLEQVASLIDGRMELIGHSKGGNLAVYAAMHAAEEVQNRITHIYNLDGPGFRTEVYGMGYFEKIADRIIKIIPRSSIVGMILENHGAYRIVDSKSVGLLQHDPFSWLVDRIDFVYVEQLDETQRIMDESLNEWILSLSKEELACVVNTIYQVVVASEAKDLIELTQNWTKSLAGMKDAYQNLEEETKGNLQRIFKSFVKASAGKFKQEAKNYLRTRL